MTYDKDLATEIFRNAVLEAMDTAAAEIFGHHAKLGATDGDLPRLFKAIDAQLDVLSERFGHALYEDWIGTPRYEAERAQLIALGVPVVDDAARQ